MLGAIIGDIVGSVYEWHNIKHKDFELFKDECFFTDDSVMTLAVAEALTNYFNKNGYEIKEDELKKEVIDSFHKFGKLYPCAGYGGHFGEWLRTESRNPYNSCGNGSAMRVSPVGWYGKTLEDTEKLARLTAEVTHNHPDGVAGAVSVAGVICLARQGKSKEELKAYMENFYPVDFTLDEIRPDYRFNEICKTTVPQAFRAFYEAENFEDTVRNAISLGGDSDTLAAIAGSMAEAFYGVDEKTKSKALSFLDSRLLGVFECFKSNW